MSETIFHEMNNVDPNERVQVGSYRVDVHGHQKLKDVIQICRLLINLSLHLKVPIIETRYHAENVLENLCSKFLNHQTIPTQLRNIYEHAVSFIKHFSIEHIY